jgi:hypothetical protein
MADERDDQATQVGHSVVPEEGAQETAVHRSPAQSGPEAAGKTESFFQTAQPSDEQQGAAPTPPPPSEEPRAPQSPAEADRMAADQQDPFNEKPHLYAAGAFVGAFVFAQILKRITGGGDD